MGEKLETFSIVFFKLVGRQNPLSPGGKICTIYPSYVMSCIH